MFITVFGLAFAIQPDPIWALRYVLPWPGMMTGQILSGVDPPEAVKYQLLVVFLPAGANGLGGWALFWRRPGGGATTATDCARPNENAARKAAQIVGMSEALPARFYRPQVRT